MSDLEMQNIANKPRNRRAVVKGAAWSVPVIAAAIAAPAASASGEQWNAKLSASCGTLGLIAPGFVIESTGTDPIPAGTSFTVVKSGVIGLGVLGTLGIITGTVLNVISINGNNVTIQTTAPLAGSQSISLGLLSVNIIFSATMSLVGSDLNAGDNSATLNGTLILCSTS